MLMGSGMVMGGRLIGEEPVRRGRSRIDRGRRRARLRCRVDGKLPDAIGLDRSRTVDHPAGRLRILSPGRDRRRA
jgi:hypothetical protein